MTGGDEGPRKRLVPNFVVLLFGQLTSKATALVGIFLLGHYLGDENYGRYSVALALPLALDPLADLGLSFIVIRDGAGRPALIRRFTVEMLPIKMLLASALLAAVYAAARLLDLPRELADTAIILAVAKAIDSGTSFVRSVFEAREHMEYEAASLILDGVVRLAFVVYALGSGFGLVGIAKATVLASLVTALATWTVALRRFLPGLVWRFDVSDSLGHLRASVPIALVGVFEGLSLRIDTIMVGRIAGDAEAGHFAASVRLVEPLLIVPLVMGMALLPLVSRHLFEGRDTIDRLFRAGLHLALIVALLQVVTLVGLGRPILELLFGTPFVEADRTLHILSFALVPLAVRAMVVNVLMALGQQHRLLMAQTAGNATNLVAAMAFIPVAGASGAALAVILGEVVSVIIALRTVSRTVSVDAVEMLRTAAAGALAAAILAIGMGAAAFPATVLAALSVFASVRALGVVRADEIAYLRTVDPRVAWISRLLLAPLRQR